MPKTNQKKPKNLEEIVEEFHNLPRHKKNCNHKGHYVNCSECAKELFYHYGLKDAKYFFCSAIRQVHAGVAEGE